MPDLLELENLQTSFFTRDGEVHAVRGVSFSLNAGELIGIVGESGCGKSVTCKSILQLLGNNGKITGGSVRFRGDCLAQKTPQQMRQIRGNEIAMIFQDPMTALNPVLTIGRQMTEILMRNKGLSRSAAKEKALAMLDSVGIADASRRFNQYPHEFSGGMRQRVMIAIALSCDPQLLIADEPTTALDVTVQAQIMTLLNELKREFNTAIIMITHDLGVVAGICDKVLVMYAGRTMEYGKARDVFYHPAHPYSIGLLNAVPRLDAEGESLLTIPGNPPNLLRLPTGCPFQPRCPHAMEACNSAPPLEEFAPGRLRACFRNVGELV